MCYLDLEVQNLVPLGVCVLLNDPSTQLGKKKNTHTSASLELDSYVISSSLKSELQLKGNLFACKASLYERIHQILSVFF